MNKKFFAALSSAAILLSSSAPLIALANDDQEPMVEVEASGVVDGVVDGAVAINEKNFPDENLRNAVKAAADAEEVTDAQEIKTLVLTNSWGSYSVTGEDGKLTSVNITEVPDMTINGMDPNGSADPTANATLTNLDVTPTSTANVSKITSLEGLEYLTSLETFIFMGNNNISSLDLSNNTALKSLFIGTYSSLTAPTTTPEMNTTQKKEAQNGDPVYTVGIGNNALTSVTLPETDTLEQVFIGGNKALTTLDLSNCPMITMVEASNNDLANINVSNLKYLLSLDVQHNELPQLDLTSNPKLWQLNAWDNNLYDLKVPNNIQEINVGTNKLTSFDASKFKNLTILALDQNMLTELKLPENQNEGVELILQARWNHLASLDLSDINLKEGSAMNSQWIYANDTDSAVDILSYDPSFNIKQVITKDDNENYAPKGGSFDKNKKGIFTFNKGQSDWNPQYVSYTYNTGNTNVTDPEYPTVPAGYMTVYINSTSLMNRLYNPNSGEHFYTKDTHEKDVLVDLGWQDEGIGWVAPTTSSVPVYRLYNPNAGDHHYTKDSNERDTLVRIGWENEGVGWYSAEGNSVEPSKRFHVEVYREYNPNAKAAGAHNYTISPIENDTLVSIGWIDEGIGWWALK